MTTSHLLGCCWQKDDVLVEKQRKGSLSTVLAGMYLVASLWRSRMDAPSKALHKSLK